MKDIFDAKIMCEQCDVQMKPTNIEKSGFHLRAMHCPRCNDKIIHPGDLHDLEQYNGLRQKTFNVKLRMVGNSHAISIPKEIVDFINETHQRMHKQMSDMVRLGFEDFGKLSISFFNDPQRREREW